MADLVEELENFSINVHCVDPHASAGDVMTQHGITLHAQLSGPYDATIVAVGHDEFKNHTPEYFRNFSRTPCIILDIKGIYRNHELNNIKYWSL